MFPVTKMKVKYPDPTINNPKQSKPNKEGSHGMLFENGLNISNEFYRIHERAIIYKKPTPVQIVKVDYPTRSKARITEAYYRTPSTTDYNGIYRGKYIDFEAKETNNLSFSFTHIYPHQIDHLKEVAKHGGIGFILIYYKKTGDVVLLDIAVFEELRAASENGGLKSIPVEVAKTRGISVNLGYTPPIDYLRAVDQLYFKEKEPRA